MKLIDNHRKWVALNISDKSLFFTMDVNYISAKTFFGGVNFYEIPSSTPFFHDNYFKYIKYQLKNKYQNYFMSEVEEENLFFILQNINRYKKQLREIKERKEKVEAMLDRLEELVFTIDTPMTLQDKRIQLIKLKNIHERQMSFFESKLYQLRCEQLALLYFPLYQSILSISKFYSGLSIETIIFYLYLDFSFDFPSNFLVFVGDKTPLRHSELCKVIHCHPLLAEIEKFYCRGLFVNNVSCVYSLFYEMEKRNSVITAAIFYKYFSLYTSGKFVCCLEDNQRKFFDCSAIVFYMLSFLSPKYVFVVGINN